MPAFNSVPLNYYPAQKSILFRTPPCIFRTRSAVRRDCCHFCESRRPLKKQSFMKLPPENPLKPGYLLRLNFFFCHQSIHCFFDVKQACGLWN